MSHYKIKGGTSLSGSIRVHGCKNAALPILAATILNGGKSTIHNCPHLSDVESIINILKTLGCQVSRNGNDVIVDSSIFSGRDLPASVMRETRGSSLFAGALLARTGRAFIAGSGGCSIGKRPIDLHLKAFKELGADVSFRPDGILCRALHIHPCKINLDFPSVGATENIMLSTALSPSPTIITNAAKEPEIQNLADYLRSIGVHIKGDGTSEIYIKGTTCPKNGEATVIPDRIVAATYVSALSCAGGKIEVNGISPGLISPVLAIYRRMGIKVSTLKDGFSVERVSRCINLPHISTGPYPQFPTDCQPLVIASMATAYGFGSVREKIFENRFCHCQRLSAMGADIEVSGRIALVRGVCSLKGAYVDACDLRSGASLTAAALGADGDTYISQIKYIDRGYENLCSDLNSLGAKIERIE